MEIEVSGIGALPALWEFGVCPQRGKETTEAKIWSLGHQLQCFISTGSARTVVWFVHFSKNPTNAMLKFRLSVLEWSYLSPLVGYLL